MLLKMPLVLLFVLSLPLGATECNVIRTVPIRLINEAAVQPKLVTAAEREAAYILKSLCVDLDWAAVPSTKALEMHITVAPLGPAITKDSLGVTIFNALDGNHGAVFLSRVRALQAPYASRIGLGRLLGCVLAHEIGHLLLSNRTHSPEGVMIAHFGEAEVFKAAQSRLTFTRADREIFRIHCPEDVPFSPKQ
jgi:hypothetical protein